MPAMSTPVSERRPGRRGAAVAATATRSFANATTQRWIGLISRKTTVPSSISDPSAAVPRTSAISGSTVWTMRTPRTRSTSARPPRRETRQPEQDRDGRQQQHQDRAAPAEQAAQRDVDERREDASSAHQVAEHALERVVGRGDLEQRDRLRRAATRGEGPRERAEVGGPDDSRPSRRARRRRRSGRRGAPPRAGGRPTSGRVNVCGRSVMSRRIERKSPAAASRPA